MKAELKILGHSFSVRIDNAEDEEYYRNIAKTLNDDLNSFLSKMDIRSDTKALVRLLFMLALENDKFKKSLSEGEVLKVLDRCISKLEI